MYSADRSSDRFYTDITFIIFCAIIVLILFVGSLTVFLIMIGAYKWLQKSTRDAEAVIDTTISPTVCHSVFEPELFELIGLGNYSKVYKVKVHDKEVAIKLFKNEKLVAKKTWNNEKKIYMTDRMTHPNILQHLDINLNMSIESYWLVFEYHPLGSIYDYLQVCPVIVH